METKLKTLKVPDLRALLTTSGTPAPGKANKQDLIARIIAAPAAVAAYNAQYGQAPAAATNDDLLAPPEEIDWDVDQLNASEHEDAQPAIEQATSHSTLADAKMSGSAAPATPIEPASIGNTLPPPSTEEDPDETRKRQRAERFGIPYVAPRTKKAPATKGKPSAQSTQPTAEELQKKQQRAERFGIQVQSTDSSSESKRKRDAPVVEEVDAEEQERRRKRAERFGIKV